MPPRLRMAPPGLARTEYADRAGVDGPAVRSWTPAKVSRMVTVGRCGRGSRWRLQAWPEAGHADHAGVDGPAVGRLRWQRRDLVRVVDYISGPGLISRSRSAICTVRKEPPEARQTVHMSGFASARHSKQYPLFNGSPLINVVPFFNPIFPGIFHYFV